MLFTRESDYAIRIVRALRDGGKFRVRDICVSEEIPEAFAYKILKKLENAQIVSVSRGTHGGCMLIKKLEDLYLYDIVLAIEPDFAIIHCMRQQCSRNGEGTECSVHREMRRVQNVLLEELKAKSMKEILNS